MNETEQNNYPNRHHIYGPFHSNGCTICREWDCSSDGYRVGMAENVSSTVSISLTIDGGSAVSASLSSDIASLIELDGSYTCPPGSSLTITIDTSSYNATID
jgi:hypothetical protein